MDSLSNRQKVALAKQFNLIVRAINDFQLSNWGKREEFEFKELVKIEKEILLFVEHLLESSTYIINEEPSSLVIDIENFSEDLKMQLKYSKLPQALNLASRATILASSISGFAPILKKHISRGIYAYS